MAERIDGLTYTKGADGDQIKGDPFFNAPGEFLVQNMALELLKVPQWAKIFSDQIDYYRRMDYSLRSLPALRLYNEEAIKEFESWFVSGDVKADIIFPASVRRNDLQQLQDTLSGALLQQFRRPEFFDLMGQKVPGLNELGKRFSINKALGFEWGDDMVPLTQITINFRLDLREWDKYLEETFRTKDTPYEASLKNLDRIVTTIQGLKDSEVQTEVPLDQKQT